MTLIKRSLDIAKQKIIEQAQKKRKDHNASDILAI